MLGIQLKINKTNKHNNVLLIILSARLDQFRIIDPSCLVVLLGSENDLNRIGSGFLLLRVNKYAATRPELWNGPSDSLERALKSRSGAEE